MPRPCSVCTSDHRHEVDQALAAGVSVRAIARSHGLSERATARHRDAGHQARPPDTADAVRSVNRPKGDTADPDNADPAVGAQSPGGEAAPPEETAGESARNPDATAQSPDTAAPATTRGDDLGRRLIAGDKRPIAVDWSNAEHVRHVVAVARGEKRGDELEAWLDERAAEQREERAELMGLRGTGWLRRAPW